MQLQYISNAFGKTTAAIITIEEWYQLKEKYPDIDSLEDGVPQWQKDLVYSRRKLINEPGQLVPLEEFLEQMEKEAEKEDLAGN